MNSHYADSTVDWNSWHFKMKPVQERIRLRSQPEGKCMVFMGQRTADGYGVVRVAGKRAMVHKVMWELENGPIPEGMQLDHKCENEPCWRLDHLQVLTPRENTLKSDNPAARNARKTHCKYGHEFTEENTRVFLRGGSARRECRTCRKEIVKAQREQRQQRRQVACTVDDQGNVIG